MDDQDKAKLIADDLAHVLTALADLLNGYPMRELAVGWREAAGRVAASLRHAGVDDDGTWDTFGTNPKR